MEGETRTDKRIQENGIGGSIEYGKKTDRAERSALSNMCEDTSSKRGQKRATNSSDYNIYIAVFQTCQRPTANENPPATTVTCDLLDRSEKRTQPGQLAKEARSEKREARSEGARTRQRLWKVTDGKMKGLRGNSSPSETVTTMKQNHTTKTVF